MEFIPLCPEISVLLNVLLSNVTTLNLKFVSLQINNIQL